MKTKLLGLIAVASFLGLSPASATTYVYTGSVFTVFSSPDLAIEDAEEGSNNITGSFTVSSPIAANFSGSVTPTSFSFSNGVKTYTSSNVPDPAIPFADFVIGTDSNGVIILWLIELSGDFLCISGAGAVGECTPVGILPAGPIPNDFSGTADSVSASDLEGTWSTTPIPTALPLFAGGLGLLGVFARRRRRRPSAIAAITPNDMPNCD